MIDIITESICLRKHLKFSKSDFGLTDINKMTKQNFAEMSRYNIMYNKCSYSIVPY